MTFNGIKEVARRFLQDTIEPYRWSDGELRRNVQFALRELNRIRPETKYAAGRLTDGTELPDDDDAALALDDRFEEAVVYYAVHLCYLDDGADTANLQLAETYLQKFNTKSQL